MPAPLDDWLRVTHARGSLLAHNLLPARWGFRLDESPSASWHLVLKGDAVVLLPEREPVLLGPGDLVLLPRGPAHELASHVDARTVPLDRWAPPEGAKPVTTVLCGEYRGSSCPITSLWRDLPEVIHLPASVLADEPRVQGVIDLLVAEFEAPAGGAEPLVASLLDALMIYVLRAWTRSDEGAGTWVGGLEDPALADTLRKVHAQPAAPWTVEELAQEAGMSRAAFSRVFSERLGEPPMQYVRRWRMAHAARLLTEDADRPVAHIAEEVGYTSEFAFNRAFKRVIGQPPGRFRRSAFAP